MVEPTQLVAHLADDSDECKPPERASRVAGSPKTSSTFGIPIARSLRQTFECRAFEIRKLGTARETSVPPRDPECPVDVPLGQLEHPGTQAVGPDGGSQTSCGSPPNPRGASAQSGNSVLISVESRTRRTRCGRSGSASSGRTPPHREVPSPFGQCTETTAIESRVGNERGRCFSAALWSGQ